MFSEPSWWEARHAPGGSRGLECPRPPASGGTGGDQESPPRKCRRPQAEAWPPASTTHRLRASSVTAIHASTHFRVDICPGRRSAASALQLEDTVPPPSGHTHPPSPARGTLLRDATQNPPLVPPSSRRGPIAATPQSRKLVVQLGRPTLPVCPETLATLATGQTPGEGQALTRRRCGKAGEPQEFWRGLCSQPTGQPSRSLSEHWPPVSPGVTSVRSGEAQSETSGGGTGWASAISSHSRTSSRLRLLGTLQLQATALGQGPQWIWVGGAERVCPPPSTLCRRGKEASQAVKIHDSYSHVGES